MATEDLFARIANFVLESERIGASVAKDFKCDVAIMPQLERFLNTLIVPVTATAIGGDLIHIEVSPEVKAGGVTA